MNALVHPTVKIVPVQCPARCRVVLVLTQALEVGLHVVFALSYADNETSQVYVL